MPQKISVDTTLWKRTRRQAFDMGMTATAIVEAALTEYFRAIDAEPLPYTARPVKDPKPMSFSAEGTLIPEEKQMDAWPPPASEKSLAAYAVVIDTPEEAAAVTRSLAAAGREFHPVPKPTSQKKPRR